MDTVKVDKEVESELEAMKKGWKFVEQFLVNLHERRGKVLDKESIHFIEEIDNKLINYVKNMEVNVGEEQIRLRIDKSLNKENYDSDSEDSEEDSESISDKILKEEIKSNLGDDSNIFAKLLSKLDNRRVPDLEEFSDDCILDLGEYLNRFEEYCRENFRGSSYLWVRELERHLGGKTLEAFRSVRQKHESYEIVKGKLMKWYDDEKMIRKKDNKKRFRSSKIKEGESVYIYIVVGYYLYFN